MDKYTVYHHKLHVSFTNNITQAITIFVNVHWGPLGDLFKNYESLTWGRPGNMLLCKDFPSTFIVAQARCDYGF